MSQNILSLHRQKDILLHIAKIIAQPHWTQSHYVANGTKLKSRCTSQLLKARLVLAMSQLLWPTPALQALIRILGLLPNPQHLPLFLPDACLPGSLTMVCLCREICRLQHCCPMSGARQPLHESQMNPARPSLPFSVPPRCMPSPMLCLATSSCCLVFTICHPA